MQKILKSTFTFIFTMLLCSNLSFAQEKKKGDPFAPGENIYKHYSGTIGGRKAAMDVVWGYQGGSNFGGSYFYFLDTPGVYHFTIFEPPTFSHYEKLRAHVRQDDNPFINDENFDGNEDITMEFYIADNKLTGEFHSKSARTDAKIKLEEDYSKPIAFDIVIDRQHTGTETNNYGTVVSEIFSVGITPSTKTTNISEMDFVNKELLKFVQAGTKIQAEYIADFYKAYHKDFVKEARAFFTELGPLNMDSVTESAQYKGYKHTMLFLLPVYNDNGFLTVRKKMYRGYTDETTFLSLDVKSKKKIELKNILKIKPAGLSYMLESALRKKYNLGTSKKLSDLLLVKTMPVSENIMITHEGIVFYYNAGILLKEKPVSVYLTFNQLWNAFTPEFIERLTPLQTFFLKN